MTDKSPDLAKFMRWVRTPQFIYMMWNPKDRIAFVRFYNDIFLEKWLCPGIYTVAVFSAEGRYDIFLDDEMVIQGVTLERLERAFKSYSW